MIRTLLAVLGDDAARMRKLITALVFSAVIQGVAFVCSVPLLSALLRGDLDAAWRWVAIEAAVLVVYTVAHFRAQLAGYRTAIGISEALFTRLGDRIAQLPIGWFQPTRVGEVGRLASVGVLSVMSVPAHYLRPLVYAFVTPLTVLVGLFVFEWRLGLIALVALPAAAWAFHFSGQLIERNEVALESSHVEAANRLVEFARAQPVLRAFDQTNGADQPLDAALRAHHGVNRRFLLRGVVGIVVFSFVVQMMFSLMVLTGVSLALDRRIATAELIAVLVLTARFIGPMLEAAELGGMLRMARANLLRVNRVLTTATLPDGATDPFGNPGGDPGDGRGGGAACDGSVELDAVGFTYPDTGDDWVYGTAARPAADASGASDRSAADASRGDDAVAPLVAGRRVLDGVSFRVAPRSMTAIVGPSGSGKTTVARLIARFWDVDAGTVRVGGVDVRELPTAALVRQLAIVFQDVYLFEGTIRDNVRIGNWDADDAQVAEAMRRAGVDEITARLPDGADTQVGEGGMSLSGGERQRVSIARALLKDAPIVLADEATSALDPENEALVQEAFRTLTADRTLIVIAHRLPTVAAADQIVFLDEHGRVAELGTHDELLARDGRYAAFWAERSRAAGWRLTPSASTVPA